MHHADAGRRHGLLVERAEVGCERAAEIVFDALAQRLERNRRRGVLELPELRDPGLGQQVGPRREQLSDLQHARALARARLGEASGVAGVQTRERSPGARRREQGGARRVKPVARRDASEHPARHGDALEAAGPGAELRAELAHVGVELQPAVLERVPLQRRALGQRQHTVARRPQRLLDRLKRWRRSPSARRWLACARHSLVSGASACTVAAQTQDSGRAGSSLTPR